MIEYSLFPGGRSRIVTFSYDDGAEGDIRLVELFNRYGVKGTFHLNGKNYASMSPEELDRVRELYQGHEISCHTLHHGWMNRMPPQSMMRETLEDRRILESIAGYPVVGMSYPSGAYSAEVMEILRMCGIVYSRTTQDTRDFHFPQNFLSWHPTCHHREALPLCDTFLTNIDSEWWGQLFYIWGHSHEFRTPEDWDKMERILDRLAHNDKIWYATNQEIYHYRMAQRQLRISVDERIFYNPTDTDVWVLRDHQEALCIPANRIVTL